MQTVRSIARSTTAATVALLIVCRPLSPVFSAEDTQGFMLAQGGFEKLPPLIAPTPPPGSPSDASWGAIPFTADGSYSSTWKMGSQPEAEAKVLRECARFGRGGCEVVTFSGQECVALSTFIGNYRRRRWNLSFTAGGPNYPDAQQ